MDNGALWQYGSGSLTLASAGIDSRLMIFARYARLFVVVGLTMLGVAWATHALEHWEIVRTQDCVAHSESTSPDAKTTASHDHGCTVQDHAPAIVSAAIFIPLMERITEVIPAVLAVPSVLPLEIEHPPQILA